MTNALIFTLDYELFGDGSGNVNREQVTPTSSLMNIFDQYGAKLTLFFEYGQYSCYRKAGLLDENKLIEEQLKKAVTEGHDVQLHYHPTWFNAKYVDGTFKLNEKLYDISFLSEVEIEKVLSEGKNFLHDLLKPVNADYQCICFRAGAWSMENSQKVIPIMKKIGLFADSSVAPGAHLYSSYGKFDYRKTPYVFSDWRISESLTIEDKTSSLLEVPILTISNRFGFLKYFNSRIYKSKKIYSQFYPLKISEKNIDVFGKIKKILSRDYYMADYNSMTVKTLLEMIKHAIEKKENPDSLLPLVLIGHSKFSYYNDELYLLFESLKNSKLDISFETLSSYVRLKGVDK